MVRGWGLWKKLALRRMFLLFGTCFIVIMVIKNTFSGQVAGTMRANEAAVVAALKMLGKAQERYRLEDWDGDGFYEYAARIGGANSLFHPSPLREDLRLLSARLAGAEGGPETAESFSGYVFKVLRHRGEHAPGGRISYLDGLGNMMHGYGLVACPVSYDSTGRNMLLMDQSGVVYRKDFGSMSTSVYEDMVEFDPDITWVVWK